MFRAQRCVNELIGNENLDRDALAEAFAHLRELSLDCQELSHERTVDLLERLTPEERRTIIEFVRRGDPPRAGREGHRGRNLRPRRTGYRSTTIAAPEFRAAARLVS